MMPTVYMAGPIHHTDGDDASNWRDRTKEAVDWFDWCDPLDHADCKAGEAGEEVVEVDKELLEECDGVLVGWTGDLTVGTSMEILLAWQQGIPIVVWWRPNDKAASHTPTQMSPWLTYHATGIEDDGLKATDKLHEFMVIDE